MTVEVKNCRGRNKGSRIAGISRETRSNSFFQLACSDGIPIQNVRLRWICNLSASSNLNNYTEVSYPLLNVYVSPRAETSFPLCLRFHFVRISRQTSLGKHKTCLKLALGCSSRLCDTQHGSIVTNEATEARARQGCLGC